MHMTALHKTAYNRAKTCARAVGVGLPERVSASREMHLSRSDQVPRRAKRGALRSKVARGCAVARGRARVGASSHGVNTPPPRTSSLKAAQQALSARLSASWRRPSRRPCRNGLALLRPWTGQSPSLPIPYGRDFCPCRTGKTCKVFLYVLHGHSKEVLLQT